MDTAQWHDDRSGPFKSILYRDFSEELDRIELHSPDYISQNGRIINSQINDDFLAVGEFRPQPSFFDLYEGQFESMENRSSFDTIYAQNPSVSITETVPILQYQNFKINLRQINESIPIDADTTNTHLRYNIFSDLDGKLFSGKGFGNEFYISWDNNIYPYLTAQGNDFCGLSVGVHTLTFVVQDTFDLLFQLPSMVINVTEYIPNWDNISLQIDPHSFYDFSGDGRHDLSEIVVQGKLPNLNPFYSNTGPIKPEYIQYWYFKVCQEYGNQTFEEIYKINSSQVNTTATTFSYHIQNLISSNYTFFVTIEDVHGFFSNWSSPVVIVNTSNSTLPPPYEIKLPILLDADNPPPNPVIGLINTYYANEISQISTDKILVLNASQSSDLNGDTLEYTWYFDGLGTESWYESYDIHAEVLEVSPEICGNDEDVGWEIDMRDGDHYGDWGLHKITLEVYDGVTRVNTSLIIEIIPPDVEPELTTLSLYNGYIDASTSLPYMFDAETCILYLDQLYHFDHSLDPQDLSVTYTITDLNSEITSYLGSKSIPRDEFSFEDPYLELNRALEYGIVLQYLQPGIYDINATISDGYVSISRNFTFEVKADVTPYDLSITLKNQDDIEIEQINDVYTLLLNQPVKFELNWIDNHADSEAEICLSASGLGVIYEGPGIRSLNSLTQQSFFTKAGETEVTLTVREKGIYIINLLNLDIVLIFEGYR